MQTFLSFEPRYHELTEREGKPVWVPMYNPIRECVVAECYRIRGDFGIVDSTAWVRPKVKPVDTAELWEDCRDVVTFFALSLVIGWLMALVPGIDHWVERVAQTQRPFAILAIGGTVTSFCSLGLALTLALSGKSGKRTDD